MSEDKSNGAHGGPSGLAMRPTNDTWETALERTLLQDVFRGHLQSAQRMEAINDFAMARSELELAAVALRQIERLNPKPQQPAIEA